MEQFVSQDPRSYSLYFDLNIWFRARKVTGTFEKRAPDQMDVFYFACFGRFSDVKWKQNLILSKRHDLIVSLKGELQVNNIS